MKRRKMKMLVGILFFLSVGLGLILAADNSQANGKDTGLLNRFQNRFMDENTDGISDHFRDHDNDGIPNGMDPDWLRPEDGKGYKNQEKGINKNQNGQMNKNEARNGSNWNKQSFRGSFTFRNQSKARENSCDGKFNRRGKK